MQPARTQRIASQTIRASARASHPVHRSALHRNQLATHRPAHRILCSAAHRANATSPRAAHCIANNPRTDNQPATHRPPRPLKFIKTLFFAHRPPHGAHLTHAVLHALRSTLRWFRLVRGTNFSKIQFIYIRIAILSCVRSSVGTEFENLALCPGFDSGRKFSDFFYFRHFLQS
jgi:hypothetical protein